MKIILSRDQFKLVAGKAIQEEFLNNYRDSTKGMVLMDLTVPPYGDVTITFDFPPVEVMQVAKAAGETTDE